MKCSVSDRILSHKRLAGARQKLVDSVLGIFVGSMQINAVTPRIRVHSLN
jgi:hypothetical protein